MPAVFDSKPSILLIASTWFPLSARLAMAFLRHNCAVSAVVPPGHPITFVPGIGKLYRYSGTRSLQSLRRAVLATTPDLLVPCDDSATQQLHALHSLHPDLRPLIERSLGDPASYSIVDDRYSILALAATLNIRTPFTLPITAPSDMDSWPHPSAVIKRDTSTGGAGVIIAHSQSQLTAAYGRLNQPLTAATALKRLIVNRNPVALWSWRAKLKPGIILQQLISGRPANSMITCWQGEVLASVSVEVLASQGETGSATIVRFIQNDEIDQAARTLARHLDLSGFFGLDFILHDDPASTLPHGPYFIELNPRCTQLGHLVLPHQSDLAGFLISRLTGIPPTIENPIPSDTIAFYPQAPTWNPDSPLLATAFLDVPVKAPALVAELPLPEWPYRQLPARIYHRFFPPGGGHEPSSVDPAKPSRTAFTT